ncbi:MAG: FAD-dependent oxidoreductase [Magnetococcales bacterium]|nr:FAD-dependent oxidoreductase [Magnetococcales bacterium]
MNPIILGAGAAGLAAALHLLRHGHRPLVLEAAKTPGGRLRSFRDPHTGEVFDNGPHLLLGACTETLDLLRQLGSDAHLWRAEAMAFPFFSPQTGGYRLACPAWPAPWHLIAGLLRLPGLTLNDRLRLLAPGYALTTGKPPLPGETVTQWLQRHRQSTNLLHRLWEPLTLAILNEPPASADAGLLAAVLDRILHGGVEAGRPYVPRVPLSRLLAEPAQTAIERQGGTVRCQTPVRHLEVAGDRVVAVVTATERISVRGAVIAAVPHHVLSRILPAWHPGWPVTPAYAPIVSIHMRWSQPGGLPVPLVGLPGAMCHWLFDHRRLAGQDENQPAHISGVISGAYREVHWPKERLIAQAQREVAALAPGLGQEGSMRGRVVRMVQATLAPWPDIVAARPGPLTPWRNLFLAGDWCATGLPATVESAVISGRQAARQVQGGD